MKAFSRAQSFIASVVVACVVCISAGAAEPPQGAAIASAHRLATDAGYEILQQGGNAFDAAVAVAGALAVVEPYSSGLGGGGFFLLHRASDKEQVFVDGRETAPAAARPEQYIDENGAPRPGATTQGGTSVGIPGLPAALVHVAQRYGRLPLHVTLAPAVKLARFGFPVDNRYARIAKLRERHLQSYPRAAKIFLHDGAAPPPGHVVRQPELATTLERLGGEGSPAFYQGSVAEALVRSVNAAGGTWSMSDLARYRVVERAPIRVRYRGATIVSAPLPSAGGIALAQSLTMLENRNIGDPLEPRYAHLIAEALRRAFQDRALYLGDGDQVEVPVARLTDKTYLQQRGETIDPRHATPSAELKAGDMAKAESGNTTHLSVVDAAGNRVAATLSINWIFGSGIVAGDTGVLLNNEMDDFTVRKDVANSYRLRGSDANAIAPGKRPLSSMTPTFVEDARGVLVLGAPGGSRIVSQVLLATLAYLHAERVDLRALVAAPRYHHQYLPDRLEVEPEAFDASWRTAMSGYGHRLETANRKWGNLQAVFQTRDRRHAEAASDPRGSDVAWY
ncbi:MAG: gamma-glutamyltransferase [Rhodospirillaceae bacterium]